MEEAGETLAAYPSSGTDWPYALAQLYKGSHHAPLPKDTHLGILPQGNLEETSCGQISQLDICQLLSTGPQLVYPSGLKGHDEPIMTTLPELLSSGTSIIAIEHLYLEINIPPKEESDTRALPIGKASIIQATNPHKSPPKLEGSMTTEVKHLLDQAIIKASSCESEQSSLEKITTTAVTTSPTQKSEVSVPPVDTSSQASIKEAEGSLEDIPANICLIAAVYSSRSVSARVDPSEAPGQCQQSHQQYASPQKVPKHQEAESYLGSGGIPASELNLRRLHQLLQLRLSILRQSWRPKPISKWQSWRPRQPGAHSIQAAKAACSKAISKAGAWKASQAVMFQEEHGKYMHSLEEQAFGEERRSCHEVLSSYQAALCHSPQPLRGAVAASYHLLLGQAPPLHIHSFCPHRTLFCRRTAIYNCSLPCQCPNSLQDQKGSILCQSQWGTHPWVELTPAAMLGGPPSPKK